MKTGFQKLLKPVTLKLVDAEIEFMKVCEY